MCLMSSQVFFPLIQSHILPLIEVGSTHSYVACNMPDKLGVVVEETIIDITIASSLG